MRQAQEAHGLGDLCTLEQLQREICTIERAGAEQSRVQHQAIEAIEAEQHMIDEALLQLDLAEKQDAEESEIVLGPINPPVRYTLPVLRREVVDALPLLRAQAAERRRTRALLTRPHWSTQDVECLNVAVQNERMRARALGQGNEAPQWDWIASQVPYHTPSDCQTRWHFYERRELNRARWGTAEKKDLATLVQEHETRGEPISWEEVARSLGTGRTGAQVLEMYQRTAKPVIQWTAERDALLLETVREVGPEWKTVVERLGLPPACATMCHQRHSKLKTSGLTLGRWRADEDAALRAAVAEYGCDWKRVEIRVPERSGQQCRERWVGRLANIPEGESHATRRNWSKEEDERLRACVHACKTWVQVAKFVGGRSDKMVRERWLLLRRREEEEDRRRRGLHVPARRRAPDGTEGEGTGGDTEGSVDEATGGAASGLSGTSECGSGSAGEDAPGDEMVVRRAAPNEGAGRGSSGAASAGDACSTADPKATAL
ncbi:hypothetical protein MSPP1_002870 [Malassezia sp. CBS 17886]|nr:hypothetical protein MSPP1_002870 [Malassezia sp. CBS 17886]